MELAESDPFSRGVFGRVSIQSVDVLANIKHHAAFFVSLGARLKQIREERGWRQEDMLTHGISLRHWQRIEAGKSITVTTLLKIADAFNVPPSELIADLYRKRK